MLVVRLASFLEALQGFSLGAFSYRGKGSDFSVFLLQIGRRSVSWSCFHLLKSIFLSLLVVRLAMLLRSSPGFFPGGFFVLRRKCGFLDFVLLFGEESLPLE